MPVHECIEAWNALRNDRLLITKILLAVTQLPKEVWRNDVFHQKVSRISDDPLSIYLIPLGKDGLNTGAIVQVSRPGPRAIISALAGAITSWLYMKGYRRTAVLVKDARGNGMAFTFTSDTDVECTRVIAHTLGSGRGMKN